MNTEQTDGIVREHIDDDVELVEQRLTFRIDPEALRSAFEVWEQRQR